MFIKYPKILQIPMFMYFYYWAKCIGCGKHGRGQNYLSPIPRQVPKL